MERPERLSAVKICGFRPDTNTQHNHIQVGVAETQVSPCIFDVEIMEGNILQGQTRISVRSHERRRQKEGRRKRRRRVEQTSRGRRREGGGRREERRKVSQPLLLQVFLLEFCELSSSSSLPSFGCIGCHASC